MIFSHLPLRHEMVRMMSKSVTAFALSAEVILLMNFTHTLIVYLLMLILHFCPPSAFLPCSSIPWAQPHSLVTIPCFLTYLLADFWYRSYQYLPLYTNKSFRAAQKRPPSSQNVFTQFHSKRKWGQSFIRDCKMYVCKYSGLKIYFLLMYRWQSSPVGSMVLRVFNSTVWFFIRDTSRSVGLYSA